MKTPQLDQYGKQRFFLHREIKTTVQYAHLLFSFKEFHIHRYAPRGY
jgi:hypothetical protein